MTQVERGFSSVSQLANKIETHAIVITLAGDQVLKKLRGWSEVSETILPVISAYFSQLKETLNKIAAEIETSEQSLGIVTPQPENEETSSIQAPPISKAETEIHNPTEVVFFTLDEISIIANRIDRSDPPKKEWSSLRFRFPILNQLIKVSFSTTVEKEGAFEIKLSSARNNRQQ
ncbi:MAG: hypothetical protein COU66_02220, partial [Candidatus Pacebacteria bacterium CG10_big_fil_rev_8_21_14_0_10_44_11]